MSFDRVFAYDLAPGQVNEFLCPTDANFLGIGFLPDPTDVGGALLASTMMGGGPQSQRHKLVVWAAVDQISDRLVARIEVTTTGVPIELPDDAVYIGSAIRPGTDIAAHAFLIGWRKNGQNRNA